MLSKTNKEKLDPRIKRTRNLIIKAFEQLLTEKTFEDISVQDITNQAEINRATFYSHFQDKYDLLDIVISQRFIQEVEKRTLNACHYTPANLRNLILVVCEFLSRVHNESPQPHQQYESQSEATIKKIVLELLSHWFQQTDPKISAEIPATVATWAIYGLASLYSHMKKRPNLEKFVDEALPLVAVNLEQFA